ncbi:hypothetical protein [Chitinophaga solisilvae]|uniref:hypothetical protein n=1 Tax=Chitinophaga solisilvae TaxID=1233460 RepID=UPI00136D7A4A|nr:hypothetical protein [Chitinophaga solisilvae]
MIRSELSRLKGILRADYLLGCGTGIIGLCLSGVLTGFLGLPVSFILIVSAVTLLYGLVALFLALQQEPYPWLLNVLVIANWIWTLISVVLLILYFREATVFGKVFLVLQIIVVGMLAWLEGKFVRK